MLGYIPSPPSNGISVGPLRLHMYGLLIVAGVFAAVWLADRRWQARGGEPGTFSAIALWAVPGGLIGARIYHVITDYELYTRHPLDAFKVWQGGLGIWGGIAGGTLAAWLYVRRHHLDFPAIMDTVAPALPLAQAIGRWGNFFNQELFGRPTKLPWGLKIDSGIVSNLFAAVNKPVPPAYLKAAAFHPTFLYESLWDLAVVALVLWTEKHVRLRKGYLFAVYVALYTFGRFFTEYMRIDFAHKFLGLRINDWVSVIVFLAAASLVVWKGLVRRGAPADEGVDDSERERDRVAVASGHTGGTGAPVDESSTGLTTDDEPKATAAEVDLFAAEVATAEVPVAESAAPEAEPPAVEPEPSTPPPSQPEPTAAAPAPAPEPAAALLAPEPVAAAPEPAPAAPEPAAAAPEPAAAAPEPAAAAPEPAAAAPEPVAAAPEPAPAAPEPAAEPEVDAPAPELTPEPAVPSVVEPAPAAPLADADPEKAPHPVTPPSGEAEKEAPA